MIDYTHLAALHAILQTGSFDAAANRLNVTPSAISQRIKTLEEHLGTTLVVRANPAIATPAGQRLFRHAAEVALLESGLAADLQGLLPRAAIPLRIVVNADSLDTWFIRAMARAPGFLFDIGTDDQESSADWLRRGEVIAAVTARARPVQGCDCVPLGALRYLATAGPAFAARHFPDGFSGAGAQTAPMLMFNRKDHSQAHWLARETGTRISPPVHMLPSTRGFVDAALAGIGWGLNPEPLVRDHIASGRLVALGQNPVYDVPLYWQFNRIATSALAPLTAAVKSTARAALVTTP
jgi:LysR family transcriptional regulator (chromosome initiation inhibitor)